jgi:hypothetical protein
MEDEMVEMLKSQIIQHNWHVEIDGVKVLDFPLATRRYI